MDEQTLIHDNDVVYKLKKIVGSKDFSAQLIKTIIISHYKKISYNINVLQQTESLRWSTQSRLAIWLSSLFTRRLVGLRTLRRFRLKDIPTESKTLISTYVNT